MFEAELPQDPNKLPQQRKTVGMHLSGLLKKVLRESGPNPTYADHAHEESTASGLPSSQPFGWMDKDFRESHMANLDAAANDAAKKQFEAAASAGEPNPRDMAELDQMNDFGDFLTGVEAARNKRPPSE